MNTRIERIARLNRIPAHAEGPDLPRDAPRTSPPLQIDVGETLRMEVQRCEERLDAARDDLRRWLLSHGEDSTPPRKASAYNTAKATVLRMRRDKSLEL